MTSDTPMPIAALADWLATHRPVTVLTGAGISTASGIPDYRDANGHWKRSAPITHQQFVGSASVRQRYWARSMAGWPRFVAAQPNAAHRALARLEQAGHVGAIVTQNVDRLHQRAGSRQVIDLHGRLDIVACLDCNARYRRDWLQRQLTARNPGWADTTDRIAPDGDADIEGADFSTFDVPACPRCGGVLKPDVVFYGGTLAPWHRQHAEDRVAGAGALLIVGSSMMIGSAHRLARVALAHNLPMAAVNQGRTRVDEWLELKITDDCSQALHALVADSAMAQR